MKEFAAQIEALLLDADGVIQSPPANWSHRIRSLCGRDHDPDAFVDAVFAAERPCLRGQASWPEALQTVLSRFDSEATIADALLLWTLIEPSDQVLELLRQVQVPVYLATNQQLQRAEYMKQQLGYENRFRLLFFSCDMGVCKPEPEYFRAIVSALGKKAESLLFIDDHRRNVDAARAYGLTAEQFHLRSGAPRMAEILRHYRLLSDTDAME